MRRRRSNWRAITATFLGLLVSIGVFGAAIDRMPGRGVELTTGGDGLQAGESAASDRVFDKLFREGIEQLRAGRPHDAALAFEAARQRRPHVPEAYVNLGFAYLEMGAAQVAGAAFEKAIAIRPGQANAYFGLAESRQRLGDEIGATSAMRAYLELAAPDDPHRAKAMTAIGSSGLSRLVQSPMSADDRPDVVADGRSGHRPVATVTDVMRAPWLAPDGHVELAALAAGRTVVLNVWATWCAPCRAELPSLQRLNDALDPTRFAVIGISVDEDPELVGEFLRDAGVRYQNYIDKGGRLVAKALAVEGYPQTFVVAADGTVRQSVLGARVWDDPVITALIEGER